MPGRSPGREATVVDLGAYPEQVATTDGRVPGERGRQTRQRLLEATVELLATTSWRSVKVTDIARQARTSPATFYQYFANVEQAIQVLAEGMVDQAGQLAELVGGDWSEEASWDTALAVTEGFLAYWEDNRAVFRVVDLATEEGDAQLRGIRVRALNAVTVALAQVIATASPSPREDRAPRRPPRRRRPHGRGGDARRHVRQRVGPPLRLRVLGDPHRQADRHPGPHAALGRHRSPGTPAEVPPREARGRGPARCWAAPAPPPRGAT